MVQALFCSKLLVSFRAGQSSAVNASFLFDTNNGACMNTSSCVISLLRRTFWYSTRKTHTSRIRPISVNHHVFSLKDHTCNHHFVCNWSRMVCASRTKTWTSSQYHPFGASNKCFTSILIRTRPCTKVLFEMLNNSVFDENGNSISTCRER